MGLTPKREGGNGPPMREADPPGSLTPPRFFDRAEACRELLRLVQRTLPCSHPPSQSHNPYEVGYVPEWAEPLG